MLPNWTGLFLIAPNKILIAPKPTTVFYHKFCFVRPPAPIVAPLVVATGRTGAMTPIQFGLRAIFLVPSPRLHSGDAREFIGGFAGVIEPVESHPAMRANAAPPSN